MFTLPDGRIITDAQTGQELANAVAGPLLSPLDISKVKIGDVLAPEDEFSYEFDFGAGWVHRCNIEDEPIDPLEVLGSVPSQPRARSEERRVGIGCRCGSSFRDCKKDA